MADVRMPRRVEEARELFFVQKRDPEALVPPHILRSWDRCRVGEKHLEPTLLHPTTLDERRHALNFLVECAHPELDSLAEHAADTQCVVVLTDARGLILEESGCKEFMPRLQRVAFQPGVEWSEDDRGTNAVGTAIAERKPVMVLGGEHYLPSIGVFGCAAAPIFDGRGEIVGVFDMSGEAMRIDRHALGLVSIAARHVEHRMMLATARGQVVRFHERPGLLGTSREGVLLLDEGHIVAANQAALDMLDTSWAGVLGAPLPDVFGHAWSRIERRRDAIELPNGVAVACVAELVQGPSRPTARRIARPVADATATLLDQAVRIVDAGVPLLVTGETGSGKEVFARRVHERSRRRSGPFVAVNCAALPDTLIEAELFGYEEGAFTGSRRRGTPGRLREAHGGVLLLDEIGDMPLALQTRLLRVLEERVVTPLGGGRDVKVDFDLICATHADLPALAAAERFRADLLYRVAGYTVAVPALRDRDDRPVLIRDLFDACGGAARELRLDPAALDRLDAWKWPGNIRELRSVLQTLVALADTGDTIGVDDLPMAMRDEGAPPSGPVDQALADVAQDAIDRMLESCGQNVAEAASRLGVHRSTIYRRLRRQSR